MGDRRQLCDEQTWCDNAVTTSFTMLGRFAAASNLALLVAFDDGLAAIERAVAAEELEQFLADRNDERLRHLAVFKPRDGEAPLWDFPDGTLYLREVAAFVVSEMLGWHLVPGTVVVTHAELGLGSLQRFVPHDPERTWFQLRTSAAPHIDVQLDQMVVFDALIDNADRKASHVLLEQAIDDSSAVVAGAIKLVDHGVAFNVERKLRTVSWDRAGDALPADIVTDLVDLRRHHEDRFATLAPLLDQAEIAAMINRLDALLESRCFPVPHGPRVVPWPPV